MGDVTYSIDVKTGDRLFSGTDANVYIKLHCNNGDSTEEKLLDCMFRNDLETGQLDNFDFKRQKNLSSVDFIEFWRDDAGILDDWYVDYIKVTKMTSAKELYEFPLFRWIKAGTKYKIVNYDTNLPQTEPYTDQRKMELEDKRQKYELGPHFEGAPSQV
ncbi:polyunsaturated fatty acid 5-lipoxygenase-like [Ruditapes philippinarum]|uniref:polyunsaturated fatty acid 5-lipoxygenase-like n=1 Tax=Ruditapes philippinarum TaxID=129788 RepID=UPI00295BAE11|nr:polyunsaturated fatty acid 5-lipoxygenase-like [Ruditapes philippinarum]